MQYRLGIDIGSKTAKLVILDEGDAAVFSQYSLHRSNVLNTIGELLGNTIWRFGDQEVQVCVTGSGGARFAEDLGLPYAQEVVANRRALKRYLPQADVAIELGGEDAKILFLRGDIEQRMNGSCAGGTGGFIDVMCGMLSVKAREFNSLAIAHTHVYPIASRCAVFAQTDVRPLINAGARKSDIAASVLQAVVTQTISGLACGRAIEGKVAFLGGPCEVYSELVQRFRKTLGLSASEALKPKDAHLFVASGAALIAGDSKGMALVSDAESNQAEGCTLSLQALKDRIGALAPEQEGRARALPALFANKEELAAFRERHAANKVLRSRLTGYEGAVFVGIDAGSTSLKLAIINEQGELLYRAYENNQGNVVETARTALSDFYRASPRDYDGTPLTTVAQSLVCGYGEELLKAAFRVDLGEVETVAHLRAAQEFCPHASFVLDIGGQDIKCMSLKAGHIETIMLNEACSSGCGALIQGFARSLGHTRWTFAEEALEAQSPVDLGTRCTVFMTSRVRHAQKEGASTSDLSAGLAYSVVRNALYKVMGMNSLAQLGEQVVVQGGTFMNDAVLRAFELESGRNVIRPDIADTMGAYGAALLARDSYVRKSPSTLLNAYELANLVQKQSSMRCEACTNACNLAVSSFSFAEDTRQALSLAQILEKRAHTPGAWGISPKEEALLPKQEDLGAKVFVSGNRCERGAAWAAKAFGTDAALAPRNTVVRARPKSNMMAFEQRLRFCCATQTERTQASTVQREQSCAPEHTAGGHLLGIPPVLNLYEQYPYWQALFTELGFAVVPPELSSGELYRRGAAAVLSESVCYPAKLMHGHLERLIARGVSCLFMPTFSRVEGLACPVVCGYGHAAKRDVPVFSGGHTQLLSVELAAVHPSFEELRTLCEQAGEIKSEEELAKALEVAATADRHFCEQLWQQAEAELRALEQNGGTGIVLLGHSYHSDPGINHGIDRILANWGYTVFSTNSLERLACNTLFPDEPQVASQFLREPQEAPAQTPHPELSCKEEQAYPAGTWPQAARLYRVAAFAAAHPNLQLIQLHSFSCGLDALTTSVVRHIVYAAGKPYTAIKLDEMVDTATLRIRLRSLDYALKKGARARNTSTRFAAKHLQHAGPKADEEADILTLEPFTPEDIACGLALLNNDLCYQMLAVGGQVLRRTEAAKHKGSYTLLLPTLCKTCRGAELERVLNQTLTQTHTQASCLTSNQTRSSCSSITINSEVQETSIRAFRDAVSSQTHISAAFETAPRIGVLGNAAMLLTPEFNDRLLQRIQAEGARPVLPSLEAVFVSEQPLPDLLPGLYEQGVRDFISVQSFGCARSHVGARGMLPKLKEQYPNCNITFLEYDPGVSQINQLSRLKLAIAIASERASQQPVSRVL